MTTATIDTDLNLKFSKPRIVMTSRGEREVSDARPTEEFWTAWRENKDVLKAGGYSVSKYDGEWKVTLWRETMKSEDRKVALEASRAGDADIEIPIPDGLELMPFQRAGVAYALDRNGTLIGDEMGLGKTIQAIAFANKIEAKRILVVAPASLLANWRNEINRWQTLGLGVYVVRPGLPLPVVDSGWVVVNYDIVGRYEKELHAREWDLAVFDECQQMKTRTAKRTLTLLGGGRGEKAKQPVPAKRRLMLTGTPIMNRPAELFSILHALDPKRWSTWTTFAKRYCAATWDGYSFNADGASNLDELNVRLRETVMVRRLKKDVLTELPPKTRQVVTLDIDSDAAAAAVAAENEVYERTEAQTAEVTYAMQKAEAEGDDEAYKAAVAQLKAVQGIAFSEMNRVRHETAIAKIPQVIEHLKATTGKVLVFAHHRNVVAAICDAVRDEGVVSITGDTQNDKRQPIVDAFQSDPSIRFFVGNIRAAGVGLTLTASSHVVFAELDWTPSNVTQAEDRAHRKGQRDAVLVQHLVFDGSLDAKMAKLLVSKQRVMDQALDKQVEIREAEVPLAPQLADPVVLEQRPVSPSPQIVLRPDQVSAIHTALRVVAGYDADRAQSLNGVGFSKLDTRFGCELSERDSLSPRQAVAAMKMIRKYRRQYPVQLYEQIFGGE